MLWSPHHLQSFVPPPQLRQYTPNSKYLADHRPPRLSSAGFSASSPPIPPRCPPQRPKPKALSMTTRLVCVSVKLAKLQVDNTQANTLRLIIAVFSKSWCPYCKATKALLSEMGAKFEVTELDQVGMQGFPSCHITSIPSDRKLTRTYDR